MAILSAHHAVNMWWQGFSYVYRKL